MMKIDSTKACEKMSWSFVKKVLLEISLPDSMFQVIMAYITSVNMTML